MYAIIDSTYQDAKRGNLVRVDFYLEPGEPLYGTYYVPLPKREITSKELARFTDKNGVVDQAAVETFIAKNIGYEYRNTPFNCHFFQQPATLEDLDDAVQERIKTLKTCVAKNAQTSIEFNPVRELCVLTKPAEKYETGMVVEVGVELAEAR